MGIHFLFPAHPTKSTIVDEVFAPQLDAVVGRGFTASLCPDAVVREGRALRNVPEGSTICYRGWMFNAVGYARVSDAVGAASATMFTSPASYLATHHLPNWYPLISEFTPETRVFSLTGELEAELRSLGWEAFFIKDFVKSLKTSVGSIIRDPSHIGIVVAEMERVRGEIEGGICVRRVEEFLPETERRFFVIDGRAFAADDAPIPKIAEDVARRIPSRFFSVDVVQRRDGVLRVVEVGDGQVSDLVGWSPEAFASIWPSMPSLT